MAIQKELWGILSEVGEIYRYTLTGPGKVRAVVTDLGAILLSLWVPDREGQLRDVVLGYDRLESCYQNPPHLGTTVGRSANRIGGACFSLNGKEYPLAKNDGENNLHSGPDFYRLRRWQAVEGEDGCSLTFSLESPDGDQGYPGNAKIAVTYTVTADSLHLTYRASADQDTIMNLTNHSYFQLDGHDAGDFSHQRVWMDADYYTPTDAALIPTGEIAPVEGTPMDFRSFRPIGPSIDADFPQLRQSGGYDHNWVLNHPPGCFAVSAKAESEASGIGMEVLTDRPGIQFYTGNFLAAELPGKNGAVYNRRTGYCFETHHFPDAIHHDNFPSPILRAGEEYRTETEFRFYRI